jgi:hypothetical protein
MGHNLLKLQQTYTDWPKRQLTQSILPYERECSDLNLPLTSRTLWQRCDLFIELGGSHFETIFVNSISNN